MKSRLEDLLATADTQLASRSYDAAIDTYRTALDEPGAAEAGVGEKLEAACRARDEARGIVRPEPAPAPAAVEIATPAVESLAPPRVQELAPPPAAGPPVEYPPIEPPSFDLVEDSPSRPELYRGEQNRDVKKLSILDAAVLPEEDGGLPYLARLGVAALIALATVLVVYFLK